MLDNTTNDLWGVLTALSLLVFFALVAWKNLAERVPAWVRTGVGVAALVLAVAALLALF